MFDCLWIGIVTALFVETFTEAFNRTWNEASEVTQYKPSHASAILVISVSFSKNLFPFTLILMSDQLLKLDLIQENTEKDIHTGILENGYTFLCQIIYGLEHYPWSRNGVLKWMLNFPQIKHGTLLKWQFYVLFVYQFLNKITTLDLLKGFFNSFLTLNLSF